MITEAFFFLLPLKVCAYPIARGPMGSVSQHPPCRGSSDSPGRNRQTSAVAWALGPVPEARSAPRALPSRLPSPPLLPQSERSAVALRAAVLRAHCRLNTISTHCSSWSALSTSSFPSTHTDVLCDRSSVLAPATKSCHPGRIPGQTDYLAESSGQLPPWKRIPNALQICLLLPSKVSPRPHEKTAGREQGLCLP